MQVDGLLAVVTGAASGLGAATVKALLASGAKVLALDKPFSMEAGFGQVDDCEFVYLDVRDEGAVMAALDASVARFGPLRIAVNCAGICPAKRILGKEGPMPMAHFEQVLSVNVMGTFNVMRLAAAKMQQAEVLPESGERGVIINTASIAATEGQIGQAAYSASKAAVEGLCLPAARELAAWGIRVNTIAPGVMQTAMVAAMSVEVQAQLAASIPFPKRLGQASEFANLVLHIIQNAYINGTTIRLDGALRLSP